jgi:type VI secretion system secreted protein Hcp
MTSTAAIPTRASSSRRHCHIRRAAGLHDVPNLAYLTVGSIKSDSRMRGREGQIEVRGFHHRVQRPINAVTGSVGTRRSHSLLTIRKDIDFKTSGLLRLAHEHGSPLSPWILDLYHMPVSGNEKRYFSIYLVNARIAEYRVVMPTLAEAKNALIHEYEEISFIYDKIKLESKSHVPEIGAAALNGHLFEADATGNVFDADWAEEQAKVAVLRVLKLLGDKADDFASDANLAQAIRNKVLGKGVGKPAGNNSTGTSSPDGQGQPNINDELE